MSSDRTRPKADITTKLFRGSVIQKETVTHPNTIRFKIMSDAVDFDGDLVLPAGGRWDDYLNNPVVLWAHGFLQPPIGKCVRIWRPDEHAIYADIEFAVEEYEFAAQIYKLYKGKFLNACSIGFRILASEPPGHNIRSTRPDVGRKCQRVIRSFSLVEVSCVPIGANPEALQKAIGEGLVTSKALRSSLLVEIRAQECRDIVRKSVGWSAPRIERLSPQELEGLVRAIGAESRTTQKDSLSARPPGGPQDVDGIARKIRAGLLDVVRDAITKGLGHPKR